jgi:hypothetical protein
MIRSVRLLVAGLTAAGFLAACSQDAVSPNNAAAPRFSGGSGGGGGGGSVAGGGGSTSTGGGGGGGGGGKVSCTPSLTVAGAATEALSGNQFQATYVFNSCQSKNRVNMTATDLATGQVVWQSVPDLAGTIAIWTLPYKLASYRVDARAYSGSAFTLAATASTIINTLDPIACTPFLHETATSGYWGVYAAIWLATDSQDCGQGGTVSMRVTNLNTGVDEISYPNIGMSSFIDFEGPIVSYDTPYRVYAELRSSTGELLDSKTVDIRSAVFR